MTKLDQHFIHNIRNCVSSLGELCRSPLKSSITVVIISISLFLPTALYLVNINIKNITTSWKQAPEITVFLAQNLSEQQITSIKNSISLEEYVNKIITIDPKSSLDEFLLLTNHKEMHNFLTTSPFGYILIIQLNNDLKTNKYEVKHFINKYHKNNLIDLITYNLSLKEKLNSILTIIDKITIIMAIILSITILLTIYQSIKSIVDHKKDLVFIANLIGATNSFIYREFLYYGLWYGFIGGLLSCLITLTTTLIIESSINSITRIYNHDFLLISINHVLATNIILFSILLGFFATYYCIRKEINNVSTNYAPKI